MEGYDFLEDALNDILWDDEFAKWMARMDFESMDFII